MNIPSNLFIIFDILICIIFLFCIIKGVINGFIYELVNILCLAVSFAIAWFVSPILASKVPLIVLDVQNELAAKLYDISNVSILVNNILWLVIIVLVLNLLFLIIKPIFKKISKIPVIGPFNRILGGVLGALRAFVICLLISVLITMPIVKNGKAVKEGTLLRYSDNLTNVTTNFILDNINIDKIKEEVEDFDVDKAREDLAAWLVAQGVLDE